MKKALRQYLDRYSEAPSLSTLPSLPGHYRHGLIIPVYRESIDDRERFTRWAGQQPGTLLIMVVNRPDNDPDTNWARCWFDDHSRWHNDLPAPIHLRQLEAGSTLLLVDRARRGSPLPHREGVGLARKIGADMLTALIARKQVSSPYIFTSDADVTLPDNYFAAAGQHADAALLYPFRHSLSGNEPVDRATQCYDWSLHYYVAGLRFAGSPYAFHTIGSTLAIHYLHYVQVRGFPRRAGGEDFYLLNKLAKTGTITALTVQPIDIRSRRSSRVPFGTGPAVNRLIGSGDPTAIELYHPDCFVVLRECLDALDCWADTPDGDPGAANTLWSQSPALRELSSVLDHTRRHGRDSLGRRRHLHHWLDGFRTLKLIHSLRDNHFGTITLADWAALPQHKQPFPVDHPLPYFVSGAGIC